MGWIARLHFWKFWNCPSKTRETSKFSKITRVIYPKDFPNQICDYWLTTTNQQTLCFESNIFEERAITNQRAGNYKITPFMAQCRLQSTVWLKPITVPVHRRSRFKVNTTSYRRWNGVVCLLCMKNLLWGYYRINVTLAY